MQIFLKDRIKIKDLNKKIYFNLAVYRRIQVTQLCLNSILNNFRSDCHIELEI